MTVLVTGVLFVTGARWAAGATERAVAARPEGWTTLPSGLELGVFTVDPTPRAGDGRVVVVRIDPTRFALRLSVASAGRPWRTAAGWLAEEPPVLAAINASMFEPGGVATAMLVADGHVDNGRLSADNAVLAFDPAGGVRLVDRTCEPFERARYRSLVQGIRMFGCGGNTWAPQPRAWSEAAIGQDVDGNVLFVFARTPWPMHTFVEHVAGLGIGLARLQHADGGPPAQLAVRDGRDVVELTGSWESGVREHDGQATAQPIPNLLGVVAR